MSIHNLSDEQLRTALKELEQAVYKHERWSEVLYGTLICRLPPDERDLSPDAHRLCQFGQWYYHAQSTGLETHPGFVEIAAEHKRVHQYAADLLRSSMTDLPMSIDDYERLVSTLKLLRLEVATIQRELRDALHSLDALTGTPSRLGMLTPLREQQELVKRQVQACTLAMMDLDHFKSINDRYGHLVGDQVLIAVAHHATSHLRPYDRVYRYGGEEFLICLADTDLPRAADIIDRLRAELAELAHEAGAHETVHVTASFGLAALEASTPVEQSIDRADHALYLAKASGRNRSMVWDPSTPALAETATRQ